MKTANPYPLSEAEVRDCPCGDCRGLVVIWDRCDEYAEPLFVTDGRPWGKGWIIKDRREMFAIGKLPLRDRLPTQEAAVEAVLTEFGQRHCDAWVSSWPLIPAGRNGPLWMVELRG